MDHEFNLPAHHIELLTLIKTHGKAPELFEIPYGNNAFDLLIALRENLKRHGWPRPARDRAIDLCMTGDYENLKMFVKACLD
jgi:hypothetical protein